MGSALDRLDYSNDAATTSVRGPLSVVEYAMEQPVMRPLDILWVVLHQLLKQL